jgi:hypothetical protein
LGITFYLYKFKNYETDMGYRRGRVYRVESRSTVTGGVSGSFLDGFG